MLWLWAFCNKNASPQQPSTPLRFWGRSVAFANQQECLPPHNRFGRPERTWSNGARPYNRGGHSSKPLRPNRSLEIIFKQGLSRHLGHPVYWVFFNITIDNFQPSNMITIANYNITIIPLVFKKASLSGFHFIYLFRYKILTAKRDFLAPCICCNNIRLKNGKPMKIFSRWNLPLVEAEKNCQSLCSCRQICFVTAPPPPLPPKKRRVLRSSLRWWRNLFFLLENKMPLKIFCFLSRYIFFRATKQNIYLEAFFYFFLTMKAKNWRANLNI